MFYIVPKNYQQLLIKNVYNTAGFYAEMYIKLSTTLIN